MERKRKKDYNLKNLFFEINTRLIREDRKVYLTSSTDDITEDMKDYFKKIDIKLRVKWEGDRKTNCETKEINYPIIEYNIDLLQVEIERYG